MRLGRGLIAALSLPALVLGWAGARAADITEIVLPSVPDTPPASLVVLQSTRTPSAAIDMAPIVPFQAAPALALRERKPLPFVDVTGSVSPASGEAQEPAPARREPAGADVPAVPEPDLQPSASPAASAPAVDAPVAAVQPADIVAALRDLVQSDSPRGKNESGAQAKQRLKDRQAIAEFYGLHGNAPLWIDGNRLSASAKAALGRIDRAGEDGLSLAAYAVPTLTEATPGKLAAVDVAISEAIVAYGRQAAGGRIDPLRIDPLITAKPTVPEAADILAWVSVAPDADAALRAYNPPQPGYAELRDKLAELRQQDTPMAKETIPSGPTLKPGMRDARVPLVRARFGLDLPSATESDDLVYDTRVAAAVADFQRANGIAASGLLTPRTISALSGGNPRRLENELIANMERWRWLPRDLGADHIAVNIADYSLEVVEGGAVVHRARVVVGKPDHQTPVFSDTMRFVIVNPYWNVPLSIIKKEMMPKLAENPNYFADHGYEVVERNGITYVRQPPGDDNALGRIKFMFPNQHAVYLHDTNARALFGKDKRAFSHGCVRVDQPFKLAEVVLGPSWPEKRVKKLIGGEERTINLPHPLPIHLTYFTSFVDQSGALQLRDDIYGYSGRVKLALGLRD